MNTHLKHVSWKQLSISKGHFFLTCNGTISLFFELSKSHFYLLLIIIFHCTMCWSFSFTALALWEASTCKSKNKSTGFATVTWRKCVHCRIILTQDNFPQVETISSQGRNDPDKRTATNSCTIFAPGQSCHSFFRPKLPQSFRLEL